MPEAQFHCFKTYSDYYKGALSMKPTMLEAFLMFKREIGTLEGIRGVQVDDKCCATTPRCEKVEELASEEFSNKGKVVNGKKIKE